jgi:hypothetical protein
MSEENRHFVKRGYREDFLWLLTFSDLFLSMGLLRDLSFGTHADTWLKKLNSFKFFIALDMLRLADTSLTNSRALAIE